MWVTMLKDVAPEQYGKRGQYGWAEEIQWEKGETYNFDKCFAHDLIFNGDAKEAEPVIDPKKAYTVEQVVHAALGDVPMHKDEHGTVHIDLSKIGGF